MKKIYLLVLFLMPAFVCAAPRPGQTSKTPEEIIKEEFNDATRDHLIFTSIMGIFTSFAKVFLDPHNIPEVKQNVSTILSGIFNLAYAITRSPLPDEKKAELVQLMISYCVKMAKEAQQNQKI